MHNHSTSYDRSEQCSSPCGAELVVCLSHVPSPRPGWRGLITLVTSPYTMECNVGVTSGWLSVDICTVRTTVTSVTSVTRASLSAARMLLSGQLISPPPAQAPVLYTPAHAQRAPLTVASRASNKHSRGLHDVLQSRRRPLPAQLAPWQWPVDGVIYNLYAGFTCSGVPELHN